MREQARGFGDRVASSGAAAADEARAGDATDVVEAARALDVAQALCCPPPCPPGLARVAANH